MALACVGFKPHCLLIPYWFIETSNMSLGMPTVFALLPPVPAIVHLRSFVSQMCPEKQWAKHHWKDNEEKWQLPRKLSPSAGFPKGRMKNLEQILRRCPAISTFLAELHRFPRKSSWNEKQKWWNQVFLGGIVTLRETTVPLKSPKKPHCRGAEDSPYLWYHHLGSRSKPFHPEIKLPEFSPKKHPKSHGAAGDVHIFGRKNGGDEKISVSAFSPMVTISWNASMSKQCQICLGKIYRRYEAQHFLWWWMGVMIFFVNFGSCLLKRRDYNDYNRDIELFISSRARTSTAAAAVAAELLPVQLDKPNKSLTT